MKDFAALEARNVLLENQLREFKSKQQNLGATTVAPPLSSISADEAFDNLIAAPVSSPESDSDHSDDAPQARINRLFKAPLSPELHETGHFVRCMPMPISDHETHANTYVIDAPAASASKLTADPQQMSQGIKAHSPVDTKPTQAVSIRGTKFTAAKQYELHTIISYY